MAESVLETDVNWIKATLQRVESLLMGCQARCKDEMGDVYDRMHAVEYYAAECKGAKDEQGKHEDHRPQKHQAYAMYMQGAIAVLNIIVLVYLAVHFGSK